MMDATANRLRTEEKRRGLESQELLELFIASPSDLLRGLEAI